VLSIGCVRFLRSVTFWLLLHHYHNHLLLLLILLTSLFGPGRLAQVGGYDLFFFDSLFCWRCSLGWFLGGGGGGGGGRILLVLHFASFGGADHTIIINRPPNLARVPKVSTYAVS